ncbi:MAG: radical SAM protein [Bacteroidetes bacterium]|nr:MAG: radical SAM protein [Bacteroidota bacterium]
MHPADTKNFINKLTPRRLVNAIKVLSSYYLSRITKKPVQWGMPITVSIEPTTACNLRCPECPSGLRSFMRPTGNLQQPLFQNIIDQLRKDLLFLIFYFQGEPYLNKDFLDMVKYASEKGIYTITSTNAHFLNDENAQKTIDSGLDRLIISIDGTTQEVYENYRKEGELNKVLQGTKNIVKWKKKMGSATPHVVFQFLVVRPNEHQMEDVLQLANELGVDEVKFKTAQVYDFENGNPLLPTNEKYSRYRKQKDGTYRIKNKLLNHCWKLWHSCVITWDGKIVPCCFDKDAQHQLGNLTEHNFKNIWNGSAYNIFRKKILTGRNKIDICTNCTEGTKVWL